MYHGFLNLNIGYSRADDFGKEIFIKFSMIHLSQELTHLEVMRIVWNLKWIDEFYVAE